MTARGALVAALLVLAACGDESRVLDADAGKVVAFCSGDGWAKCIAAACPGGFVILLDPQGPTPGILRCKRAGEP